MFYISKSFLEFPFGLYTVDTDDKEKNIEN
jgi:hypothetical protein